MSELITNRPKENSRITTSLEDGDITIWLRSMQSVNEPVAKHYHRLGMTETAFKISKEAARSLIDQLSYHLMVDKLRK